MKSIRSLRLRFAVVQSRSIDPPAAREPGVAPAERSKYEFDWRRSQITLFFDFQCHLICLLSSFFSNLVATTQNRAEKKYAFVCHCRAFTCLFLNHFTMSSSSSFVRLASALYLLAAAAIGSVRLETEINLYSDSLARRGGRERRRRRASERGRARGKAK